MKSKWKLVTCGSGALCLIASAILTSRFFQLSGISTLEPPLTIATPTSVADSAINTLDSHADPLSITETLMAIGDTCVLPCFLGFHPGETTIDEIVAYLEETGFDEAWRRAPDHEYYPTLENYLGAGESFVFGFRGDYEDSFGGFLITFWTEHDLLKSMEITFDNPSSWLSSGVHWIDLPFVLSQREEMPEILIPPGGDFYPNEYPIYVIYQNPNVIVRYEFDLYQQHPFLCLGMERTHSIRMRLNVSDRSLAGFDDYETPRDHFGIDTETFVQFFRDNPDGCLDLSEYTDQ